MRKREYHALNVSGRFRKFERLFRLAVLALIVGASPVVAGSGEELHVRLIRNYVETHIRPWLSDPRLVNAIREQNKKTAEYTSFDFVELDKTWQFELESDTHPLIDSVLKNPLAEFLREKQDEAGGAITEIIVMDGRGLNVAVSDVTSDYWQGDEPKFRKTVGEGSEGFVIEEPTQDDSSQMLQSQASITITNEKGIPIGAVSFGINLDQL
ncbi:MAG: hypothetical protein RLZZ444_4460 [Pseudomonadota bacterium]|jgi:hypothetical protein